MSDKFCSQCGKKLNRNNKTGKCNVHYQREYSKEWRGKNQAKIKEYNSRDDVQLRRRKYFLKYNHDVDWDTYVRMYEYQNGNCTCCGDALDMLAKSTVLDHDHKTGQVRSVLCTRCNSAIEMLLESSERAVKLAEYLKRFGK